jgi:hypothetical protein
MMVTGAVTGPGTVDADAGDKIAFSGTGDVSTGTLSGAGTMEFTAGTDALTGATVSVTHLDVTGATVTLSGSIAVPSVLSSVGGNLLVANGTTLTGVGAKHLPGHRGSKDCDLQRPSRNRVTFLQFGRESWNLPEVERSMISSR